MKTFEQELKESFLDEAAQLLEDAEQCFLEFETRSEDPAVIEKIFRLAHNFKGSANAVGFPEVGSFAHKLESFLLKIKNKELPVTTDIVNLLLKSNDHLCMAIARLKEDENAATAAPELAQTLVDYTEGRIPAAAQEATSEGASEEIGEIQSEPAPESKELATASMTEPTGPEVIVAQSEGSSPRPIPVSAPAPATPPAASNKEADENIRVSLKKVDSLINNVGEIVILQTVLNQQRTQIENPLVQKTIAQLAKITKDLQEISMSLRMVPLKQTFQKMQRIVRDVAKQLDKEVELKISGDDTEIDKTILELLGDPLVHLIRNAVDHGIENRSDRALTTKPAQGKVFLEAYHRGENIIVEVRDDGKGLDAEKLKKKAIEKGILKTTDKLSERDAHHLIFAAGFSTKEQVTDVSGRGVGMDVVKTNIEQLKGEIEILTVLGQGTTFRIILPLTLAIIDGVLVSSDEDRFILPLSNIHESIQPAQADIHQRTGIGEVFSLRGENIPVLRLAHLMGKKPKKEKAAWESLALVIRDGEKPFALIVDDILGQQQVVIKKLGPELKSIKGLAGGAILGDGKAALILDLQSLVGPGGGSPTRSH